jgi:hypothetical protein
MNSTPLQAAAERRPLRLVRSGVKAWNARFLRCFARIPAFRTALHTLDLRGTSAIHGTSAARDGEASKRAPTRSRPDPIRILAVTASRIRGVDLGIILSNIGGSLTGGGLSDVWRLGSLIRKLRRL